MTQFDEAAIIRRINEGDRVAFSFLFTTYYSDLVSFAITFLKEKDSSEEIVQDIFTKIWENRETFSINTSVKSFLLRSVQNRCIDRIRHLTIRNRHRNSTLAPPLLLENDTEHYILYSELQAALKNALIELPTEIADCFRLNRFEGLTYQEIAEKKDISVRTVEVRIGKALQTLREKLRDFLLL